MDLGCLVMLIVSVTCLNWSNSCLCVSAYVCMCVALLPVYSRHLIAAALIVSRGLDRPVFLYSVPHGHSDQRYSHLSRESTLASQQRSIGRDILTESHRHACRRGNTVGQPRCRVHSIIKESSRVRHSTYCVSISSIRNTNFQVGLLADPQTPDTSSKQYLVTQES